MAAIYDTIGIGYAQIRRADPRLAALIHDALGDAASVLNVGAGAGSYEPSDRPVVAVEPSEVMLAQHPGARKVRAVAGSLPFGAGAFAASMAIMTLHHWPDPLAGLRELRRVSGRQVVFTWDPGFHRELWIITDYLPEVRALEHAWFPTLEATVEALGAHTVIPFEIPWDFTDGYQPAYWRRPEAYLDPVIRAASSSFAQLPDRVVDPAIARLHADLDSGDWHRRHASLLTQSQMDYGYRLLIAG